jgi:hypothetical protein
LKDLNVVDVVDHIRQQIMITFDKRRKIRSKLRGVILSSVMQRLNVKSRNIEKINTSRGGDKGAKVSGIDSDDNA